MTNQGFDDTVQSLRRILTTGAVAAALLLVGASVLFAASLLFQVSRIAPFGGWGVLAVLAVAAIVAAAVWLRGASRLLGPRRRGPVFTSEMVFRAPPPAPVRAARPPAPATTAGRLGAETLINRLVGERRYDEALARLDQIEASDPALAHFCAVKRSAIARRQRRV